MQVLHGSRTEPAQLTAAMAAGAFALTLLVIVVTPLRFAYQAPGVHLILETAEGCIALAVTFVVAGRFREHRRWHELLLTLGLGVLAVTNLLLSAVPVALALSQDGELSRWAPLMVRLVGTVLVAAAAVAPAAAVVPPGRTRQVVLASVGALGLLGATAGWLGDSLPPVIDPAVDLGDRTQVVVTGHPVVVATQVLSGLLYALAAVCFTRRAGDGADDELLRWLGAGCALAAVARVDYVLFPSLYSDFVHLGDALRLGFYVCMLVGAAREVRSYWARAAVLEDRRRLARDLHDGLTQELSYIYARSQRLESHPDDGRMAREISGAAGRALDEARYAIGALTRPLDQAFGQSLQQTVEDLARRYGVRTTTSIERCAQVSAGQGEAILRITGEALRNAVRHGQARCVSVSLTENPLELTVQDDGRGFDPRRVASHGFGLTSMRERAESVGASYDLTSAEGQGTKVQVSWS